MTIRQIITMAHPHTGFSADSLHKLVMGGYDFDPNQDEARASIRSLFSATGKTVPINRQQKPGGISRLAGVSRILVQADVAGDWSADSRVAGVRDLGEIDFDLSIGDEVAVRGDIELSGSQSSSLVTDPDTGEVSRRRHGHRAVRPSQAHEFVTAKLARSGFDVDQMTVSSLIRSQRKSKTLTIARIEAVGTVTDDSKFSEALRSGLGRGRAFGAGLLRHALIG